MIDPVRCLAKWCIILPFVLNSVASDASNADDQIGMDEFVRAIRSRVPAGWEVRGSSAACTVTSPRAMPLHPSPATGLPAGSIQALRVSD